MVSGNSAIRVVIADDHPPIRSRIRAALEAGGCVVLGEGATADAAVRLALELEPDVALLDVSMPGGGIEAARQISRTAPDVRVVMLTQSREDGDLFDALRAGASGYLLKDTPPQSLAAVLRQVLNGEAALAPGLLARVLGEFRAAPPRPFGGSHAAKLSSREREVMELLSQGLTTEEVATSLFLSPTTVRVHVSTVLRKLAVKDRASALSLLRNRSARHPQAL